MKNPLRNGIGGILNAMLYTLAVVVALETIFVRGFLIALPDFVKAILTVVYGVCIVLYLVWFAARFFKSSRDIRHFLFDIAITVLIVIMIFPLPAAASVVAFRVVYSMFAEFFRRTGITALLAQVRINPARILLLSFLGAATVGTALLMLPSATVNGLGAPFVDALFTATSATCVTGLIVRDTGTYFSGFGQTIIVLLIQVGGLGIMTFSTLFAMMIGHRLGYRHQEQIKDILDQPSPASMYQLIVRIVGITFICELAGASLLFVKWLPVMGTGTAMKSAIFHSISAFCNAGFSLNADNLAAYAGDWYVNIVFIMLIMLGGFGFVVLNDIVFSFGGKASFASRWRRLSVHSRIVLITSLVLVVAGTLGFFFFEFDNTMLGLSTLDKLMAALFQSVTCRTAGFNTVDIGGLRDVTLFIAMILMFIGASPSSTGGGIKTTTFAVLILSVRSIFVSREQVSIFGRTISHPTVYKSMAILLFSITYLVVFGTILLATQQERFADIMFEAISALGTVGLSTGMTSHLDAIGKGIVTLLMYIGRVGPLTVALAFREAKKINIAYPTTKISVG